MKNNEYEDGNCNNDDNQNKKSTDDDDVLHNLSSLTLTVRSFVDFFFEGREVKKRNERKLKKKREREKENGLGDLNVNSSSLYHTKQNKTNQKKNFSPNYSNK